MADVIAAKEQKFVEVQEKKAAEQKRGVEATRVGETSPGGVEEKKQEELKKEAGKAEEAKAAAETKAAQPKPETKEEAAEKREIVLERVYSIPLDKAYSKPGMARGTAALSMLREFLRRHMKAEGRNIRIALNLNNALGKRGRGSPLKKIKIKATKDKKGIVLAEVAA